MTKAFPDLSSKEEEALKEEARQRCQEDLYYLAKHVLGYNRITDHYHRAMAKDIDTPQYRFRLLLHPRGHFKSTMGTESRSIQKLLRNPSERILIDNVKLDNSRKFLRTIARQFESNPKFRWLWRDKWVEDYATAYHRAEMGDKLDWVARDTQDEFTLLRPYEGREASITTGAVDASMVSQHYSTIIADDLINRDYIRTIDMVEKSITHFRDLLDLLDPDGELVVIGTRWAHMDLYSWIIEEFGHKASLRVPDGYLPEAVVQRSKATPEEKKDWMISIEPTSVENPIFPEEYSAEVLQGLLEAKGPYEFGAQYLLNPTPKEHQKFQEEWIRKLDVMPKPGQMTACITVDPAKSLEDQADRSAVVVCCYDKQNNMYLMDGLNERLNEDELLEYVFALVQEWTKKARFVLPVGFEAVAFQEMYVYNLERMMMERNFFFAIEPIKRRKLSKEERILRLVPRIKNGFYVPRHMAKQSVVGREEPYDLVQRLIWELTKFPFAGKDDLADALADQLDIVHATRLPMERKHTEPETAEFVHPSTIEDKKRSKVLKARRSAQRIGVVR